MDLPRVLIVSNENDKANDIAKKIDGKLFLEENNVKYYQWKVDNKYYSCDVMLCTTERLPLGIPVDGIEAVLLHFDPKAEEVQSLDRYITTIQSIPDADVLLLACDTFPDELIKDKVLEWCHVYKFELVEMDPPELNDDMDEKYGIDRIIEALHAHSWPNRMLKGITNGRISTSNESDVSEIERELEGIQLNSLRNGTEHLFMESVLDGIMGEENADFGELFGQLMQMKEHAATLSSSNRRAAAEQLVTAFWRAMGGDPEEIEDLDE